MFTLTQQILDQIKSSKIIEKEWGKIIPSVKYLVIIGLLFLISFWIDSYLNIHLYNQSFLTMPQSLNIKQIIYGLLLTISLLIFLLFTLYRLWVNLKIIYYKLKFPLKNLNVKYYIMSFKGRVCLINIEKKELRWIKTWQTAIDLGFIGEWTNIDIDITEPSTLLKEVVKTKDGKTLRLKDFNYVAGIHTQGIPGT